MKIGQIQYEYNPDDNTTLKVMKRLISGSIFYDYIPIIKLQIEGPTGTKFYINKSQEPIQIGRTGRYDIDLSNIGGKIDFLTFTRDSLDYEGAYLLINFVYKD